MAELKELMDDAEARSTNSDDVIDDIRNDDHTVTTMRSAAHLIQRRHADFAIRLNRRWSHSRLKMSGIVTVSVRYAIFPYVEDGQSTHLDSIQFGIGSRFLRYMAARTR